MGPPKGIHLRDNASERRARERQRHIVRRVRPRQPSHRDSRRRRNAQTLGRSRIQKTGSRRRKFVLKI